MNNIQVASIKKYYDDHVIGKLKGYVYRNERVERAYEEMTTWFRKRPSNILEIGCGIGDVIYRIANLYPEANCYGFDVSPKSIEVAKILFCKNNLTFIQGDDISSFTQNDEKFDFIFLIDVFEHIPCEHRENLYDFIRLRIREGGIVFMSCPTIAHQNFLKINNPSGLQPIDEDIKIEDFLEVTKHTGLDLRYFKQVSVWNEGDYSHVVFGNLKYAPYSDRTPCNQKRIKRLVYEKLFHSAIQIKKNEEKFKLDLIREKLGADFFNALVQQ